MPCPRKKAIASAILDDKAAKFEAMAASAGSAAYTGKAGEIAGETCN